MTALLLALVLNQAAIIVPKEEPPKKCVITQKMRDVCGPERVPFIWNSECAFRCDKPRVKK